MASINDNQPFSRMTAKIINILTKFHKDWMKTMNILTKFHKHWIKNVTSTFYTNKLLTINILTKFHKDWMKTTTSIINILTNFHKDWMKTATSIFYTRSINVASRVKNGPHLCGHVFQANISIFELNRHIQKTHVLAKFPEDWTKNVTFRVFTCSHYIQIEKTAPPSDINETNVSTKFHDDWAKIVTSRVFTRFLYSHIGNTAAPTGGHLHEDLASNVTSCVFASFELSRGINGTSVLTKFHEDRTIKASRVFTRQNDDNARRTTDKRRSQKLTMSTLCS
ncbi:hypothetical protein DPMN_173321 [Dreissena polymorpha]|uniref:Uncharacterized protein n=1 Tax=Dreissena polymorpha TaxID=45954 RepID=A0A9D4E4V8_DREPO|nr:hypothetical protein DPMN_173321 [Dreissena polymorpha]